MENSQVAREQKTTRQIIMEGVAQRMRDYSAMVDSREYPYDIPDNVTNANEYIKEYLE